MTSTKLERSRMRRKVSRTVLKLTITHKSKNGEKAAILLIQLSIINRSMV